MPNIGPMWHYTLYDINMALVEHKSVLSSQYTPIQEISRVSCQKGLTRHAYAWQIGPFWQDTLDMGCI